MASGAERRSRLELVERDAELERLADAFAAARRGEHSVVLVEGQPGIGKSTLVGAALSRTPRSGLSIATAAGAALERGFAFGVVLQMLQPLVDEAGDDVFAGAAALARPVFEGDTGGRGLDDAFPRLHGLFWLTVTLAERRPVVLWADDVQWSDVPSATFLAYLAHRIEGLPIALVVGHRTGEPDGPVAACVEALGDSATGRLTLQPLSAAGTSALIARDADGALPDDVLARCAGLSGGVPLFARELVRTARTDAAVSHTGPDPVRAVSPPAVGELVERRLAGRGADAEAMARAVAVCGDRTATDRLARVAALDPAAAAAALDALAAAEIVELSPSGPSFVHVLVRQAIYERSPPGTRGLMHERLALELSESGLHDTAAVHVLAARGPRPVSETAHATETLLAAARQARTRGASSEAVALLTEVIDSTSVRVDLEEAHGELGRILARRRDPEGIEHLRAAIAFAEAPADRAFASLVLGEALFWSARFDEAGVVCREAIIELDGGDRELTLQLEAAAITAELMRGVERSRPAELEDGVAAGATVGERAVLVHVAGDLAARGTRPAAEVAAVARRAWADGTLLEGAGPDSPLFAFCGTTLAWAEDFTTALDVVDRGETLARRRGSQIGVAYSTSLRAGIHQRIGDLRRARADAEIVLEEYPATDPIATMSALAFLVETLIDQGEADAAHSRVTGLGLGGPLPVLGTVDFLLLARGSLAAARGDTAAAVADLREVGERARVAEYPNPGGLAWRGRLALALPAAQADEAVVLAEEEVERARSFAGARALGIALRAAALVGPDGDRVDRLVEADHVLRESPARLERARVLLDLGAALVVAGHVADARARLGEGMTLAHECAAGALVERALDALRATGARPRRPAVRGVDALTRHERRCAELAASGMTNREIAERQFVTLRTVEQHLSKAYRKLGISSRDALGGVLDGGDAHP